ncbi:hypothetical protein FA13DRAFT_831383 [Coprinellus micaceus]|uniref:Uncharacterized protein n=1 Tax=Coprinellus micaceus TaxID=71717 RepID=A0A4Y7S2U4_COPMI|nr:hypothetical protein FA13DRAFT_831383 [Coprinellus micaceus]
MMRYKRASYAVSMPSQLKDVFALMLGGQQLRQFSLKDVSDFPGDLMLGAPQLENLHLDRSDITWDEKAVERLQLEKPPIGCLNSLVCSDWMSHVVVNTLLEMPPRWDHMGFSYGDQVPRDPHIPSFDRA